MHKITLRCLEESEYFDSTGLHDVSVEDFEIFIEDLEDILFEYSENSENELVDDEEEFVEIELANGDEVELILKDVRDLHFKLENMGEGKKIIYKNMLMNSEMFMSYLDVLIDNVKSKNGYDVTEIDPRTLSDVELRNYE